MSHSYVITSACFDMDIIDIHKKFQKEGKTKVECWEYCDSKYNLYNLGIPAYQMIDNIWEGS